MTRTLQVDIEGLNLILGGGVPVLKRHQDYDESATLLVRGPPGSGKTIFGVQLAGALARSLSADVVYGCVELLPTELAAQHAGIKRPGLKERVVPAPYGKEPPNGEECRIFAEILDLGVSGQEVSTLGDAIEHVIVASKAAGGRPRVLVIDSLSDGYNLGASAPRELADALCKMAAREGLILVLLEEAIDATPSVWSFAVDMVIQLGPSDDVSAPGRSGSFERRLLVSKNRFGLTESLVHRFEIVQAYGIRALPHPRTYSAPWAFDLIFPGTAKPKLTPQGWSPISVPTDWPLFFTCVTVVRGPDVRHVRQVAMALGLTALPGGREIEGTDLVLDFSRPDALFDEDDGWVPGTRRKVGCGEAFISGESLLAATLQNVLQIRERPSLLRRVIAGDLRALRSLWHGDSLRHALSVLGPLLRRAKIPMILFETTSEHPSVVPPIADFADVLIHVHAGQHCQIDGYHLRTGQRFPSQTLSSS